MDFEFIIQLVNLIIVIILTILCVIFGYYYSNYGTALAFGIAGLVLSYAGKKYADSKL